MNYKWILDEAMLELKNGNKDMARELLRGFIVTNPNNEKGWLYYAKIAPNIQQRIFCLKKVLEINPDNIIAQKQLDLDTYHIKPSSATFFRVKKR